MSEEIIRTTCSFCSVGCNMDVQVVDGKPVKILQAKDYPVNHGKTCTKGFNMLKALDAPDRALYPTLRDRSTGEVKRLSWDEAASTFVGRMKAIQETHGPGSIAFLSTGQLPFEEMALLGSVAKFGMGIRHGDGNTRQCMATAVTAYKQSFGFDSPPFTYRDAEESDVIVFVGANPVIAHPILWQRFKANPHKPAIVVVDPRRTETAREATLHLPVEPKGDLVLFYTILNILIRRGWVDRDFAEKHTRGLEALARHVADFPPEAAPGPTGLSLEQIENLAELIHNGRRVSFWWTMGVNQSHQGVRTAQAIIAICLLTGNIGRVGTGPNSITGQTNAMGSRLFSNTTGLLAGRDFANPEHRETVARALGIPVERIPQDSGKNYAQILEAVGDGTIKGLWILCTNPGHSWIDKNTFFARMKKLDFLVVQDIYHSTETAVIADLVLPAAAAGEKPGTFINSERRLGIVQKVMDPPGEAKSDFDIIKLLAEVWGCGDMLGPWKDQEAAFNLLRDLTEGMPCDITGIPSWKSLLPAGGVQWPWTREMAAAAPEGIPVGEDQERRLFADGRFFTPDGKAPLLFSQIEPLPEVPDEEYPLFLLTGRGTMHQWHTQTRTGKVEILKKMYPAESYAEVNPQDAARMGLSEGEPVRVTSRRGSVVVKAMIKDSVRPGFIFLPMHYPEANFLTYPAFDPYSGQPGYKFGAVKVEKAG